MKPENYQKLEKTVLDLINNSTIIYCPDKMLAVDVEYLNKKLEGLTGEEIWLVFLAINCRIETIILMKRNEFEAFRGLVETVEFGIGGKEFLDDNVSGSHKDEWRTNEGDVE